MKHIENILNTVNVDDLRKSKDLEFIMSVKGLEYAKEAIYVFGGLTLTIPSLKAPMFKPVIQRYIANNPNINTKDLASTLGIHSRTIEKLARIVKDINKSKI